MASNQFSAIVTLLSVVVVLMGIAIAVLIVRFRQMRREHQQTIRELQLQVMNLGEIAARQSGQLQLSDRLSQKMKSARSGIDNGLLEIQHDLVEILSKNNLIG